MALSDGDKAIVELAARAAADYVIREHRATCSIDALWDNMKDAKIDIGALQRVQAVAKGGGWVVWQIVGWVMAVVLGVITAKLIMGH
jgi:hypothetical protein